MAYSRVAYAAIIAETTENTVVKPTIFIGVVNIDIQTKYGSVAASPFMFDRNVNINPVKNFIAAPVGTLTLEIEPKKFGNFLKAVGGAVVSGMYVPTIKRLVAGTTTGTPVVGATLLQATSLATGVVAAIGAASAYYDLRTVTVGFDASHVVTGTNPDGTTFTFTPSATLPATAFAVAETVTGSISSKTGTVAAVSAEGDYILVTSPSGKFTTGEVLTGGTSAAKATSGATDTTVYGHEFKMPQNSLGTYTLEIGLQNEAYRFGGVRFNAFKSVSDKSNIITADVAVIARSQFLNARVGATVGASASPVTITVDQTQGLIAADVIKVFRPSTGAFLDLSGVGIKTHTITSLVAETSITIPTLTTALAAGDLVVLSPQTPSYALGKELSWIGGSSVHIADTIEAAVISATVGSVETFDIALTNDVEERHAANGATVAGRFPTFIGLKGYKANGKIKHAYVDETYLDRLRNSTLTAVHILTTGAQIGATGIYYQLDWRLPTLVFDPYNGKLPDNALIDEEIPFTFYKGVPGYTAKALLITDETSF